METKIVKFGSKSPKSNHVCLRYTSIAMWRGKL